MPDPYQIAAIITQVRAALALTEKLAEPPAEPDQGEARASRSALNRAKLLLDRAVLAMREAHDEASIAAFVATGEAASLVI